MRWDRLAGGRDGRPTILKRLVFASSGNYLIRLEACMRIKDYRDLVNVNWIIGALHKHILVVWCKLFSNYTRNYFVLKSMLVWVYVTFQPIGLFLKNERNVKNWKIEIQTLLKTPCGLFFCSKDKSLDPPFPLTCFIFRVKLLIRWLFHHIKSSATRSIWYTRATTTSFYATTPQRQ